MPLPGGASLGRGLREIMRTQRHPLADECLMAFDALPVRMADSRVRFSDADAELAEVLVSADAHALLGLERAEDVLVAALNLCRAAARDQRRAVLVGVLVLCSALRARAGMNRLPAGEAAGLNPEDPCKLS